MSEAIIAELTAELVNSQDQQLALYELSQAMRRKQSIDEAADELVRLVAQTMKARVAGALIAVPDRPATSSCYPVGTLADEALQKWLDQVRAGRTYLLHNDGPDFDSLLVLPMELNDQIAGAMVVANKVDGPLASPDRKLGQAMANQAGIYFENLLFAEQRVAEARLQTELAMARDVQTRLLPVRPPETPGLDVFGFSKPALQVGGDAYDFFVDDEGRFHFCTGDVSGKGMSAALLMAMMRTALRNSWRFNKRISPAAAIERTNTSLYDDFTDTGMFATLFAASYEPDQKRLHYANAGHSPVIYRPRNGAARLLEADGVPVGVLTESLVVDRSLEIGDGDLLVVCTDGLNEARNEDGALLGSERLLELVDEMAGQPAETIARELLSAVDEFALDQPQADDQTLVVIRGLAG